MSKLDCDVLVKDIFNNLCIKGVHIKEAIQAVKHLNNWQTSATPTMGSDRYLFE
jgi:hypothetical protein